MTFETFDQSDEETWHDQQKYKNKNRDKEKDNAWQWQIPLENTSIQRAILETCDLRDIWSKKWGDMIWATIRQRQRQRNPLWPLRTEFFVTWQLRVTLDGIRNSCDVCPITLFYPYWHPRPGSGGNIQRIFCLAAVVLMPLASSQAENAAIQFWSKEEDFL